MTNIIDNLDFLGGKINFEIIEDDSPIDLKGENKIDEFLKDVLPKIQGLLKKKVLI